MRIESGKYLAGVSHPRWNLYDAGGGAFKDEIDFPQPFQSPPKLLIAISGFDIRIDCPNVGVQAVRVTENGFDVHISSSQGRVWELTVDWMAVGN